MAHRGQTQLETVHPRLRGELCIHTCTHLVVTGSSPLTRGTQQKEAQDDDPERFIPAYAGNSPEQP